MTHRVFAAALALVSIVSIKAADSGVTLIGMGLVAGTDLDKSGFDGQRICQFEDPANCIDQATLGGSDLIVPVEHGTGFASPLSGAMCFVHAAGRR